MFPPQDVLKSAQCRRAAAARGISPRLSSTQGSAGAGHHCACHSAAWPSGTQQSSAAEAGPTQHPCCEGRHSHHQGERGGISHLADAALPAAIVCCTQEGEFFMDERQLSCLCHALTLASADLLVQQHRKRVDTTGFFHILRFQCLCGWHCHCFPGICAWLLLDVCSDAAGSAPDVQPLRTNVHGTSHYDTCTALHRPQKHRLRSLA